MIPTDLREMALLDWLTNDCLFIVESCLPASSDASFRRYFRVVIDGQNFIVMDAPPDKEDITQFLHVTQLFKQISVNVPIIFKQNLIDGFLLLEDFGGRCFLDELNNTSVDALYALAFDELFKLHTQTSISTHDLPIYDEPLLRREMDLFQDWFLTQHLHVTIDENVWHNVQTILTNSALAQPQVCVHRDYHSRNLMMTKNGAIGVIDFQDAVIGAITYDLVSLLRDCYISWTNEQLTHWLDNYFQRLTVAKIVTCEREQFQFWFDLMGMQRHLKAIGIFSRLNLRDGKSSYLNDIPRTLNYVQEICAKYSEFTEFGAFLKTL